MPLFLSTFTKNTRKRVTCVAKNTCNGISPCNQSCRQTGLSTDNHSVQQYNSHRKHSSWGWKVRRTSRYQSYKHAIIQYSTKILAKQSKIYWMNDFQTSQLSTDIMNLTCIEFDLELWPWTRTFHYSICRLCSQHHILHSCPDGHYHISPVLSLMPLYIMLWKINKKQIDLGLLAECSYL